MFQWNTVYQICSIRLIQFHFRWTIFQYFRLPNVMRDTIVYLYEIITNKSFILSFRKNTFLVQRYKVFWMSMFKTKWFNIPIHLNVSWLIGDHTLSTYVCNYKVIKPQQKCSVFICCFCCFFVDSNHGTFVTPSLVLQMVLSIVGLIVMKNVSQWRNSILYCFICLLIFKL